MQNRYLLRGGVALLALSAAALLGACSSNNVGPGNPGSPKVFEFGFESGLDGFVADGADLEVGGDEIDWSITASDEKASAGDQSAKINADNLTDACKVWLEQELELDPNSTYSVKIDFDFATFDMGDFNHWTIVAGVLATDPEAGADLEDIYQGDTAAGSDLLEDYVWLPKSYTQTFTTGADGKAWLTLGVWGTWETERTYYIDKVKVTATKQ
jgi:hypothetical protein